MLVESLSKTLLLEESYISTVAKTASRRYKMFFIDKRNGVERRKIYHPSTELKAIQRMINDEFLERLPVHPCATAYLKGSNILNNVLPHKNNKYLLRLDFSNFFESISKADIDIFVDKNFPNYFNEWCSEDTKVLSNLVCFNQRLTIGSVTSPNLANILCYELDALIDALCGLSKITYTRYADDMFFSTNEEDLLFSLPNSIKSILKTIETPKKLRLNYKKTVHSSKKRKMSITGLIITNNREISIGRDKKRKIKSSVYNWNKLSPEDKKYLSGYLSYVKSVEPEFINKLCEKYSSTRIVEIMKYV